ncbi:MAG: FtsX-like permease family protein [Longimicrobiales bacterium]
MPVEVIGLIEDVHHYSLAEGDRYEILFPAAQDSRRSRMVAMRIDADADIEHLLPLIREHARALDPMAPLSNIATMTQRLSASVAPQRFRALLAGSLALMAFLLAVMGIYAVVANAVGRRTREIGIRLALGERPRNVVANVVSSAVKIASIGALIGVVAAFVASRWLRAFVFGVDARDPATLIVVPIVLLAAAAAAALVPAWRASRIDPLRALGRD